MCPQLVMEWPLPTAPAASLSFPSQAYVVKWWTMPWSAASAGCWMQLAFVRALQSALTTTGIRVRYMSAYGGLLENFRLPWAYVNVLLDCYNFTTVSAHAPDKQESQGKSKSIQTEDRADGMLVGNVAKACRLGSSLSLQRTEDDGKEQACKCKAQEIEANSPPESGKPVQGALDATGACCDGVVDNFGVCNGYDASGIFQVALAEGASVTALTSALGLSTSTVASASE